MIAAAESDLFKIFESPCQQPKRFLVVKPPKTTIGFLQRPRLSKYVNPPLMVIKQIRWNSLIHTEPTLRETFMILSYFSNSKIGQYILCYILPTTYSASHLYTSTYLHTLPKEVVSTKQYTSTSPLCQHFALVYYFVFMYIFVMKLFKGYVFCQLSIHLKIQYCRLLGILLVLFFPQVTLNENRTVLFQD